MFPYLMVPFFLHRRNTPNDLLLLADAPAHQLFVLLAPVDETRNALPDVLAVVQVRVDCPPEIGVTPNQAEKHGSEVLMG